MADSRVCTLLKVRVDEETKLKIRETLNHISQLYNTGKPLFTRRVLEDLSRQIDEGKEEVYIPNLDGVPRVYNLKPPPPYCENYQFDTYFICYRSIQSLCHIHPYSPESFLRGALTPVSIGWSLKSRTSSGHSQNHGKYSEDSLFWTWYLRRLNDDEYTRTHTQHAAVETMVASLAKRGLNGSQEIKCYAQDLEYDEVDQEFLRSIGITTLKGPKGFLEVDEHTLVFSVCPDIPVKQIVTDLHWPAAMIWDTVTPSEKNQTEMFPRLKKDKKRGLWKSHWPTTDPDSERVRQMIKYYAHAQLEDSDGYFGNLTIYMK
ncbi:hypothetical protein BDV41DRAFT_577397 [Aspergillus transmontanensis]|uniref:SRR1-like domain-containing protein n=1 Tax=Aspergillus transmontanensis TaxID=1034304 RepID=A0A5N6VVR4_9EURO|nr:hypothetical protein BDV41DRAFT_577397 [Aspergillus transmontanensis]